MLAQILGFTLAKTIPDNVLWGVLTGAYRVCGGVIRNKAGQIMAHLVNASDPLSLPQPGIAVSGAMNTYQLLRIVKDVALPATNHLIALSTGTMLTAGLTLAVSAAGFAFLNKKLNKIDARLQELQKDVKEIKVFLKMREHAELTSALKNLWAMADVQRDDMRQQMLVNVRQTLGQLHEFYRLQFEEAGNEGVISASEEYFTITAVANALCAGELGLHDVAARDFTDSYRYWSDLCRKVAKEKLLRDDPERFLRKRYVATVRTDELIDWLEFAHADEKGIGWIDELRSKPSKDPWGNKLTNNEVLEVELFRRLTSRDRIYQGYLSQYDYFKEQRIRPSEYQHQIEKLDRTQLVDDTFILIANELAADSQPK